MSLERVTAACPPRPHYAKLLDFWSWPCIIAQKYGLQGDVNKKADCVVFGPMTLSDRLLLTRPQALKPHLALRQRPQAAPRKNPFGALVFQYKEIGVLWYYSHVVSQLPVFVLMLAFATVAIAAAAAFRTVLVMIVPAVAVVLRLVLPGQTCHSVHGKTTLQSRDFSWDHQLLKTAKARLHGFPKWKELRALG